MINYYVYPGLETTPIRSMRRNIIYNILKTVSDEYEIPISEMKSSKRSRDIVTARQVAMWLLKKHSGETLMRIALIFGQRDHTSVLRGIRQVNDHCDTEKEFKERLEKLDRSF